MVTSTMAKLDKPSKAGGVKITPVGHTFSGKFGSNPNAKVRGRSTTPTTQEWS